MRRRTGRRHAGDFVHAVKRIQEGTQCGFFLRSLKIRELPEETIGLFKKSDTVIRIAPDPFHQFVDRRQIFAARFDFRLRLFLGFLTFRRFRRFRQVHRTGRLVIRFPLTRIGRQIQSRQLILLTLNHGHQFVAIWLDGRRQFVPRRQKIERSSQTAQRNQQHNQRADRHHNRFSDVALSVFLFLLLFFFFLAFAGFFRRFDGGSCRFFRFRNNFQSKRIIIRLFFVIFLNFFIIKFFNVRHFSG